MYRIIAVSLALMFIPCCASAEEIGGFTIRKAPSIQEKPEKIAAREAEAAVLKEDLSGVGLLTVDDVRSGIAKRTKADTKETIRVKEELAKAIEASNKKRYSESERILKKLIHEHPELASLVKWQGIYQNMAGKYEESQNTFEMMKLAYPLASFSEDLMLSYYEIDNHRYIGASDIHDMISELKKKAQQLDEGYKVEGMPIRKIYEILSEYQLLSLMLYHGEVVNSAGMKQLDKVWSMIPKEKQLHLDDFYGFNIDALGYAYGKFYNRKDILKAYVEHEKSSENKDAAKKATIK